MFRCECCAILVVVCLYQRFSTKLFIVQILFSRHGNITSYKVLYKVVIVSWGVPFMSTFLKAGELVYDFVAFSLT